jgi:hypothetical protein
MVPWSSYISGTLCPVDLESGTTMREEPAKGIEGRRTTGSYKYRPCISMIPVLSAAPAYSLSGS